MPDGLEVYDGGKFARPWNETDPAGGKLRNAWDLVRLHLCPADSDEESQRLMERQARDANLLNVLTTSMGVRENPLTIIITTASDVFDGPFYEMLQGYKRLLLGEHEDDSVFAHLFEPDLGDLEDDPRTWRKVHPHLGVTVQEDFYEREYRSALRKGSEAMLAFRTKLLNVYAENEQRAWISATQARKAMRRYDLGSLGKPRAMVAVDLSESDDFSAVSVAWYSGRPDYAMNLHTAYFFPEGALPGHPNESLYRAWASEGWLTLLPGEVIDYGRITEYVISLNDLFFIMGIGYDRYRASQMINELAAHPMAAGASNILRNISQVRGNFTAPCTAMEHGLKTGALFMDDNPINAYCFGNAVLWTDQMENFKPVKRTPSGKIDGVITMAMCLRLWLDHEEA